MRINRFFVLFVMFAFVVFLIGCQQQTKENKEISDSIKIVNETQKPAADGIEKEFNDSLDAALGELEDIENIQ